MKKFKYTIFFLFIFFIISISNVKALSFNGIIQPTCTSSSNTSFEYSSVSEFRDTCYPEINIIDNDGYNANSKIKVNISFTTHYANANMSNFSVSVDDVDFTSSCNIEINSSSHKLSCDFDFSISVNEIKYTFKTTRRGSFYPISFKYDVDLIEVGEPEPETPQFTLNSKIYLPSIDYECLSVFSNDIIRAYKNVPKNEEMTIEYDDYYINTHYMSVSGVEEFNSESKLPICSDKSNFTTDYYYRNDLSEILICVFIILTLIFIPFYAIITKLFKRWKI